MNRFSLGAALIACAVFLPACHQHRHGSDSEFSSSVVVPRKGPLKTGSVAIPIAPGKTEAWRNAIRELTGAQYNEYAASRSRFGLTTQITFLQRTPMGDFAVIHMRGNDVHDSFHQMSTSKNTWDVQWRSLTSDLHGVDFNDERKVTPAVQPISEYGDFNAKIEHPFLFVAPVEPAAASQLPGFAAALQQRADELVSSRRKLGIAQETISLQTTTKGVGLVIFWDTEDPRAKLASILMSTVPFDIWWRNEMQQFVALPLTQLIATVQTNELVGAYPRL